MFGRSKGEQGEKIKHKDFIKLYAEKMGCTEKQAEQYLSGFIYNLLQLNIWVVFISQKNMGQGF